MLSSPWQKDGRILTEGWSFHCGVVVCWAPSGKMAPGIFPQELCASGVMVCICCCTETSTDDPTKKWHLGGVRSTSTSKKVRSAQTTHETRRCRGLETPKKNVVPKMRPEKGQNGARSSATNMSQKFSDYSPKKEPQKIKYDPKGRKNKASNNNRWWSKR